MSEPLQSLDSLNDSFFRLSPDAIIVGDANGMVRHANPAASRLSGFSEAELIGQPAEHFIHPEDLPKLRSGLQKVFKGELVEGYELRALVKGGGYIWQEWNGVPLEGRSGFLSIGRDLTRRKTVEAELRESEEQFRRLAENATDMIYRMALPEGRYEYVSPASFHLFGYSPEAFYRNRLLVRDRLHPDWLEYFEQHWQMLLQGVVPATYEYQIVHRSGEVRWLNQRNMLVKADDGRPTAIEGIVTDVTARKQAEAEVLRLNSTLEQRVEERTAELKAVNEELESFSYSVSHDFRGPLRAINSFSEILREEYGHCLDAVGRDYLGRIATAAETMGRLIDGLLGLSRVLRSEVRSEPVDLSAVAHEILNEMQAARPQRQMGWRIEPELIVQGDPVLLRAMLQNLLDNAWKYTRHCLEPFIDVGRQRQESDTVFFVRDNGVGFEKQDAQKLFQPFQRLHAREDYEGSGIGLATVRRIVQRHGGRVWAAGTPNQGATIFFSISNAL